MSDLGEMRALARRWVFHREEVPPRGTRCLTDDERDRLFAWIVAWMDGSEPDPGVHEELAEDLTITPDQADDLGKAAGCWK